MGFFFFFFFFWVSFIIIMSEDKVSKLKALADTLSKLQLKSDKTEKELAWSFMSLSCGWLLVVLGLAAL